MAVLMPMSTSTNTSFGPEPRDDVASGHELAPALHQQDEEVHGLPLEPDRAVVAAQLVGGDVELEAPERASLVELRIRGGEVYLPPTHASSATWQGPADLQAFSSRRPWSRPQSRLHHQVLPPAQIVKRRAKGLPMMKTETVAECHGSDPRGLCLAGFRRHARPVRPPPGRDLRAPSRRRSVLEPNPVWRLRGPVRRDDPRPRLPAQRRRHGPLRWERRPHRLGARYLQRVRHRGGVGAVPGDLFGQPGLHRAIRHLLFKSSPSKLPTRAGQQGPGKAPDRRQCVRFRRLKVSAGFDPGARTLLEPDAVRRILDSDRRNDPRSESSTSRPGSARYDGRGNFEAGGPHRHGRRGACGRVDARLRHLQRQSGLHRVGRHLQPVESGSAELALRDRQERHGESTR